MCNKWSSNGWASTISFLGKCLSKCEKKEDNHYTFYFGRFEKFAKKVGFLD
jgi:hypothetical protein